jgi:hypothetical protein
VIDEHDSGRSRKLLGNSSSARAVASSRLTSIVTMPSVYGTNARGSPDWGRISAATPRAPAASVTPRATSA